MQNSTTLYRIEKLHLDRLKKIYSDKLYTLESNSGSYASVYINGEQIEKYNCEGAWSYAQRHASVLALNLDMGDL
jgi:hypothetical protein